MKHALAIVLFGTAIVVGCASKQKPVDTVAPKPTDGAEHAEHGNMPPEVAKFHEILSPKWHAEKGPQRMKDTCGAIADFKSTADALTKIQAGDAAKWSAGTKELADAVAAMEASCGGTDQAAFDDSFRRVHEDFHAVAELAGGEHEEAHH